MIAERQDESIAAPWTSAHGTHRTFSHVKAHIAKAVRVPPERIDISKVTCLLVDRMWHNPNRINAVQGPIVTLTAVRRRQQPTDSGVVQLAAILDLSRDQHVRLVRDIREVRRSGSATGRP
jgi:hypothetical protein